MGRGGEGNVGRGRGGSVRRGGEGSVGRGGEGSVGRKERRERWKAVVVVSTLPTVSVPCSSPPDHSMSVCLSVCLCRPSWMKVKAVVEAAVLSRRPHTLLGVSLR